MSERKQSTNNQGLPTALLYLGLFTIAGCFGVVVLGLGMAVFLWVWLHVCDWTGLSAVIPVRGWRLFWGSLLYLLIAVPVCVKLLKRR